MLLLVLCVALKDTLLALPGFSVLKKPLDAAEVVENKVSGAVAMPLVAKSAAAALVLPIASAVTVAAQLVLPTAYAAGSALGGAATADFYGVALVLAAGAFALVWLTSHAVNVLVLLCPVALKLARLVLLGFPMLCAALSPTLGLLVCAAYLALAWWLSGWAFRLVVFGWVFSMDLLLLRWRRQKVEGPIVHAFSAELDGLPVRTYGTLTRTEAGAADFSFRPWLLLPARTVRVAESAVGLEVEKGLLSPEVVRVESSRQVHTLVRLPPRYRKLEVTVAGAFGGAPGAGGCPGARLRCRVVVAEGAARPHARTSRQGAARAKHSAVGGRARQATTPVRNEVEEDAARLVARARAEHLPTARLDASCSWRGAAQNEHWECPPASYLPLNPVAVGVCRSGTRARGLAERVQRASIPPDGYVWRLIGGGRGFFPPCHVAIWRNKLAQISCDFGILSPF